MTNTVDKISEPLVSLSSGKLNCFDLNPIRPLTHAGLPLTVTEAPKKEKARKFTTIDDAVIFVLHKQMESWKIRIDVKLFERSFMEALSLFLGGLSLHLNHLIGSRVRNYDWPFGTLPFGLFGSNLEQWTLRHILGPILVIFDICHFLTISGPFEYFQKMGALRKSKFSRWRSSRLGGLRFSLVGQNG